eukprot:CAMPEP_0170838516 /NCGR_PEP_ID=MMETSP0734-20130129/3455_1 /TAXON_ID=186038 /ORGANISM="Fragilariopsis kerguelensis, Strain L26-C5" /LENGTH=51 /DNA_ID=CAMNT_0011206001 /DNA_START=486 /DNA_END=638 /DNA_ORIENTATION=-
MPPTRHPQPEPESGSVSASLSPSALPRERRPVVVGKQASSVPYLHRPKSEW